jgi:hypothetical protein
MLGALVRAAQKISKLAGISAMSKMAELNDFVASC